MTWTRRAVLKMAGGFLAAGAVPVATYEYGRRVETRWLELERVNLPVEGLAGGLEGIRIVLMSDFHLYPNTRLDFILEAIEAANRLAPDLIVLPGDFVYGTAESIFDLAPALAGLNSRLGVFCTLGNHDHWRGAGIVRRGLERSGLALLDNAGLTLSHNGARFFLAGVDDGWAGRPDLAGALANCPAGIPVILLSHLPDLADLFCRDPRISIQLSGHSHGGQVRLPVLGAPILPPYGRKYDMGLYRVGKSWLYTSRGIGVTAPIRINCRPELTEIRLLRA